MVNVFFAMVWRRQSHVFFMCNTATKVWSYCYVWMDLNMVTPADPSTHFYQHFLNHHSMNANKKVEVYLVWYCVVIMA